MILAKVPPRSPSNFPDCKFELIPSLKKKIFAFRQKELLFIAVNQPFRFYPFYNIVVARQQYNLFLLPPCKLLNTMAHSLCNGSINYWCPFVNDCDCIALCHQ